ncbi:pseudouridine-5'-phosphate glycosidase [Symbiobacterium terraclitae]|jgi:pseudouridine-5'-phosphate glycosidase|uniref:Pseudouridine-5'-phosphate glycosidase n=1 Tax=Symbiobacterium terraclitae TaxID=557451 RepID=A0ABS4JSF6_9FIRM|nr:pseudouridine-5'-phosphate glycosidase [Symbiobacterium terraclitae]MBP2018445.1 pseudouridine-5'-phosphate glycosidase [Symbiobacterium terraclitae]
MKYLLSYAPEVRDALEQGRPVVALESTIISHGMPFPENLDMAREVEEIVRQEGAVPATVALIGGRCKVGLSDEELELLATSPQAVKVSLRDMPVVLARKALGATTVAATATIAAAAGIDVFVTGGIGGVHRGAPGQPGQVWDVSADLTVLGRTSVTVVCAGAKSVLDIGATLEVLETLGVTVLGYRTDRFPGFYTRDTGYGVDARVDGPEEAAAVIRARKLTQLPGGVLVVNPVPEADALDAAEVERHIAEALEAMAAEGVTGKAVTPYLLAKMKQVTEGRSLAANLALIKHNARVGAQIAAALKRG